MRVVWRYGHGSDADKDSEGKLIQYGQGASMSVTGHGNAPFGLRLGQQRAIVLDCALSCLQ